MPRRRAEDPERERALFDRLRRAHDALTEYQDVHNATPYRCDRSGNCCTVGLQLHLMECKLIADQLKAMSGGDPDLLEPYIDRLEHAFEDEAWTWAESVGTHACAFFEDGCSIYPFRPAVCRAYGVVLEVDEWCPRKRLPAGRPFVFAQKETDRQMAELYRTLDAWGRLHPRLDYTVYMPAGVLSFLLPPARLKALKARTPKKFWKRERGYRMQYTPSYRTAESRRTNVRFPFAEKYLAREA
ncbi:MAG TPA: YkgJ family cysteine cluster protein [Candidatus Thermoplasmatota archaeon]|nr:YkgJ family cysteine cluster protein [Candidatus Thermoplasmatota archaeon]